MRLYYWLLAFIYTIIALIIGILILFVWQETAVAAIVPTATQPLITPEPGGCDRAAIMSRSLQHDRQERNDMVDVFKQLQTSTDSRVSNPTERQRQRMALQYAQTLIAIELEAITDMETVVRQFQWQHCSAAR